MCEWLSVPDKPTIELENGDRGIPALLPVPITGSAVPATTYLTLAAGDLNGRSSAARTAGTDLWFSRYLGSLVYGGLDGIITTFAIVSGVTGAQLAPHIVLILGLANLIGDGFSMATGAYLSSKSQHELFEREHQAVSEQVNNNPHAVKHLLHRIYLKKGFSPVEAHGLVETFSRTPSRITAALLHETATHSPEENRPVLEGAFTFAAFIAAGSLPLLPYVLDAILRLNLSFDLRFIISALLSAATLFLLGAGKVRLTGKKLLRSGIEMLLVGSLAGGVAYAIGLLLRNVGGEPR